MPHSQHTPKYRHYKPKNLGVVRIAGRDHYLGKYDCVLALLRSALGAVGYRYRYGRWRKLNAD